jgi:hypothetical protein
MSISPTEILGQASRTLRTFPLMAVGLILVFITQVLPGQIAFPADLTGLFVIGMSVAAEIFSYLQRGRVVTGVFTGGTVSIGSIEASDI